MATGTGNSRIILNTRERVLSSDANRSQALIGQALANAFRFLLDPQAEEDSNAGVEVMGDGTEVPLRATVLSGLRARPVVGAVDLLIEPGCVLLVDSPFPSQDDALGALVTDPGVVSSGVLTLAPNGGSTRIDVVECQRIAMVTEVENRDIFNPATGLFTPAQVDKVVTARLSYRIRQGTPGAGFPGVVAGWLPLAVCRVAASATNWDNVILWDVRPLASDRWNAPFNNPRSLPARGKAMIFTDVLTAPTERRLSGIVEAEYDGYRAGGHLAVSSALAATSYFDLAASTNRAGNFSGYSAHGHWYLYACFPFGLPRWVRYTAPDAGGRIPRGQRGILCITNTPPGFDGKPPQTGTGVSTPSIYGLLDGPSTSALCLLAGRVDAAGSPVPQGIACDGHVTSHVNPVDHKVSPSSTVAGIRAEWILTDGVSHPAGARALWIRLRANFTSTGVASYAVGGTVLISGPDGSNLAAVDTQNMQTHTYSPASNAVCSYAGVVRVPLACNPFDPTNGGSAPRSFTLTWIYNSNVSGLGDATESAQTHEVIGWEMGP